MIQKATESMEVFHVGAYVHCSCTGKDATCTNRGGVSFLLVSSYRIILQIHANVKAEMHVMHNINPRHSRSHLPSDICGIYRVL